MQWNFHNGNNIATFCNVIWFVVISLLCIIFDSKLFLSLFPIIVVDVVLYLHNFFKRCRIFFIKFSSCVCMLSLSLSGGFQMLFSVEIFQLKFIDFKVIYGWRKIFKKMTWIVCKFDLGYLFLLFMKYNTFSCWHISTHFTCSLFFYDQNHIDSICGKKLRSIWHKE